MLSRIVGRSLTRRRRRKVLGFAAVALGIVVTTTVATLALDVGDKVARELLSFGANISVTPSADGLPVTVGGVDYRPAGSGAFLNEADLIQLKKIFWRNNIVAFAPFLFAPARINGRQVTVLGSWFDRALAVSPSDVIHTGLEELHPEWKVEGNWPKDGAASDCLVGERLAREMDVHPGGLLAIDAGDHRQQELRVAGVLSTGGEEDDAVIAPLATVQKFTGLAGKVRRVEVSALIKPEDAFAHADVSKLNAQDFDRWMCTPYVSSIAYQIEQAIPGSEAKPIYQVAESEGKILHSVGLLMMVLAIAALISAGLAVASMMLATVLERRAEIGLYKSLGATDARVASIFLVESFAIGLAGGVAGYILGSLLAARLARIVFGSPIGLHWVLLPVAVALALAVSLAGSAVPLERGLKVSPATVLHNE